MPVETSGPGTQGPAVSDDDKVFAAISYVLSWLIALIVYLVKKESPYVRFHALQALMFDIVMMVVGLVFIGALIVLLVVFGVATGGIGFLPGFLLFYIIAAVYGVALFVVRLYFAYRAYRGDKLMLPILGAQAEKMSAPST